MSEAPLPRSRRYFHANERIGAARMSAPPPSNDVRRIDLQLLLEKISRSLTDDDLERVDELACRLAETSRH